jgi:hypothetical protein
MIPCSLAKLQTCNLAKYKENEKRRDGSHAFKLKAREPSLCFYIELHTNEKTKI